MISLDPSKPVSIRMRRATQAIFKIIFNNGGDPFPITGIPFRLLVQGHDKDLITLAIGSGLAVGGDNNNELTVTITDVQSDQPIDILLEVDERHREACLAKW
jgi:hypothetical protein